MEIRSCPFCGGKASVSRRESKYYYQKENGDKIIDYTYQVICNKCHARGPVVVKRQCLKDAFEFYQGPVPEQIEAIERWNTVQGE